MTATKLTPQQAGKLGGMAAARSLGPDGVRRRGEKGAATLLDRYGKEHMVRLSHKRWGRLTQNRGKEDSGKTPSL